MRTYTVSLQDIQVGEPVVTDTGEKIVVMVILDVDFMNETVTFMGMNVTDVLSTLPM